MAFIPQGTFFVPASINRSSICTQPSLSNPSRQQIRHRIVQMSATTDTPSLEKAWGAFAAKMKETNTIPPIEEWHSLIDVCVAAKESSSKAIWLLNLMRETGTRATAVTYEKMLAVCATDEDQEAGRNAAFHMVEHMFNDKILLGDVELPDGMEEVLRTILPPDAFE